MPVNECDEPTLPADPREDLIEALARLPAGRSLLERLGPGLQPAVHLIGGPVRDLLLGAAPLDLDLVVEGPTDALLAVLGGEVRSYDRFGTATVSVEGFAYDVARARRERYPHPGALPVVEPGSLREDLLRRDFTVNAAALGLSGAERGRLTAAPNALTDLDGRRLRVLHDASFTDDPTRLMRLVRYRARLRFEIEARTHELALAAVRSGALRTVSGPRIGNELRLLAREPDPIRSLAALGELELEPEIAPGFGLRAPELAARALAILGADGRRDLTVLACAAMPVGREELAARLDALGFEAVEREVIVAASRAPELARRLAAAGRPSEIADAVAGAPDEAVAVAGAAGAAAQARKWLSRLRHARLEIDGTDLLAAGVRQGPAIGAGLRAALAAELDHPGMGHEEQLAVALGAARGYAPEP